MNATWIIRQLADTPAAIKAMNHHRPQVPREILGMNRAAHYLVRLELLEGRVKETRDAVANVWRVDALTIKDNVGDLGAQAQRVLDKIIDDMRGRPDAPGRHKILEDIDADMEDPRAECMSKNT